MMRPVEGPSARAAEGQASPQDATVEARARSGLGGSAYRCIRNVACRARGGVLVLQGRVPSYFHKQVAQALVRQQLDGSITIDNQLDVAGAATNRQTA